MIYSVFGLGLDASQALPRLAGTAVAERADVRVELCARPAWFRELSPSRLLSASPYLDDSGAPMRTLSELANGWLRLSYADGTDFLLDPRGTEIWATWPEG